MTILPIHLIHLVVMKGNSLLQDVRFNCPSFHKSKYFEFDEYHTSADNLDFISSTNLIHSVQLYLNLIHAIENHHIATRTNPYGEVQLGRRGLYPRIGGHLHQRSNNDVGNQMSFINPDTLSWVLALSDGSNSPVI